MATLRMSLSNPEDIRVNGNCRAKRSVNEQDQNASSLARSQVPARITSSRGRLIIARRFQRRVAAPEMAPRPGWDA